MVRDCGRCEVRSIMYPVLAALVSLKLRMLQIATLLTLRLLMSYIYMEHLFLVFLDHTQRRTTVGRTPLAD